MKLRRRGRATEGRAARVLNFTDGVTSCCGKEKEHALLVFTQLVHASADSMEADETATEPWQRAGCSARKCRSMREFKKLYRMIKIRSRRKGVDIPAGLAGVCCNRVRSNPYAVIIQALVWSSSTGYLVWHQIVKRPNTRRCIRNYKHIIFPFFL